MTLAHRFDRVYRDNAWNGRESRSGPGSGPVATKNMVASLRTFLALVGARSLLDMGCGDGYWMPEVPGYIGIDASRRAVTIHRTRHPGRDVRVDDPMMPLPRCDVAFTRDAMQHCSLADGSRLLARLLATEPRWLLASTYLDGVNADIATALDRGRYTFYRPNLSIPPFDLGAPTLLIFDGWGYGDPDQVRESAKHLGAWRLR